MDVCSSVRKSGKLKSIFNEAFISKDDTGTRALGLNKGVLIILYFPNPKYVKIQSPF